MKTEANKKGWSIVATVITFVAVCNGLAFFLPSRSAALVVTGIYLIGIGALFLLSYYFESESLVFRALIWICENFSNPRGRKMAFFYFVLATICGLMAVLDGLGFVNIPHRGG